VASDNVSQTLGHGEGATVTSDQELFAEGLATYQKVVAANYMAHEQVGNLLHKVLLNEAKDGFVFADLACGTAPFAAAALAGTGVACYIGIDISKSSLDVAKGALSSLTCPVEFRCQDFVEAIETWEGPLDVVWIGQSLHHLLASEKRAFMRRVERLLPRDGLFLIWEPTCLEGEDREGWMERFRQMRPQWPAISDEEFAAFESHHRASDYPETAATWKGMAREAGFGQADELFTSPRQRACVYRFRH
jgi:SAM-dependent methyltransferase